ncbi:MAG TPA: ankyrin repeat domain-containing protein [Gemmata sp.]
MAGGSPSPREISDAIFRGDVEYVARALRDHREVFVTKGWVTWMHSAADVGLLPVIEMLVAAGADVNTPQSNHSVPSPEGVIDTAAAEGHLEVVRWFLDHGAVINHVITGRVRCFALAGAAGSGHLEVVKLLVERGAAVNSCWAELTPLDHAVMYGQVEVAAYLRSVGGKTAAELSAPPG